MNKRCLYGLVILFFYCLPFFCSAQTNVYPKITFEYSAIFDNSCSKAVNRSIEDSAIAELTNKVDEFSYRWNKDSKPLLTTVYNVTGIPFSFHETKAAFHLCDAFSSMSNPLLFNMRFFMRSLQGDSAGSMTQFTGLVLHEVLHRYINDIIRDLPRATTPLLEKYKNEPGPVQNHLHLFALMNEVYLRLGRKKEMAAILEYEQNVSRYKAILTRAREIVNAEGANKFLGELREGSGKPVLKSINKNQK